MVSFLGLICREDVYELGRWVTMRGSLWRTAELFSSIVAWPNTVLVVELVIGSDRWRDTTLLSTEAAGVGRGAGLLSLGRGG